VSTVYGIQSTLNIALRMTRGSCAVFLRGKVVVFHHTVLEIFVACMTTVVKYQV